jgi:colicin import membrane protein
MWDKFISFIDTLILHSLLLIILFFTIKEEPIKPKVTLPPVPKFMIQATAVDENQIQAAIRHRKSGEKHEDKVLLSQQSELSQKKQKLEETVIEETQQLDDLRQQKEQEQQRLAELKQRQQAEMAAIEELKHQQIEQKRLKQEAERLALEAEKQALIEELERQKAEQERLIQETLELKRLAEERERIRQEEAEQARLVRREAEQKSQEEARLARKAEQQAEEKRKALAKEGEIRKKALERARLAEARIFEKKRLIEKALKDIKKKVKDKWVRPRGYYSSLSCTIEIRLRSGAAISQAKIVNSSGNIIFDYSVLRAVRNASPLPIPNKVFDKFRHFNFKFRGQP